MISHGEGFQIRHKSGRYYRSELIHFGARVSYTPGTYAAVYELVSNPFGATLIYSAEHWRRYLDSPEWASVAEQFEIVSGPGCRCCGERTGTMWGTDGNWRCDKHRSRNPCAVEGCKRTGATSPGNYHNDAHLCGEHFKIAAPPGSAERRVYNRLWRLHRKRDGKDAPWSPELDRRYWRVWFRLVAIARARTAGDIDRDEINKLFGWDG
jgi:hypothetical protein